MAISLFKDPFARFKEEEEEKETMPGYKSVKTASGFASVPKTQKNVLVDMPTEVLNIDTGKTYMTSTPSVISDQSSFVAGIAERIFDVNESSFARNVTRPLANLGLTIADIPLETVDFLSNAITDVIQKIPTVLRPWEKDAKKTKEWEQFFERAREANPISKLDELIDKFQENVVLRPSIEYENASLEEKLTTRLPETILELGPSVVGSFGQFVISPAWGLTVIAGSTANDVRDKAIERGVPNITADLLGAGTGILVSWLEKIVPTRIFENGAIKNKFIGSFTKRLMDTVLLESGTEITQELVQIAAEATFRDDLGFDEVLTRTVMAGLGGALGGAGTQTIASFSNNVQRKQLFEGIKNIKPGLTIEEVGKGEGEEKITGIPKELQPFIQEAKIVVENNGTLERFGEFSKVEIKRVSRNQIRNKGDGDYIETKDGGIEIRVSDELSDIEAKKVAIHELIESNLAKQHGISFKEIDAFDKAHIDSPQPGNLPNAPYHKEHLIANEAEKLFTQAVKGIKPVEVKPVEKPTKIQQQIEKETGIKKEPSEFIRKRETTLLKDRIRNYARGIREGTINTKQEIKNTQEEIIKLIDKSNLEAEDKAKFIKSIKNIQTSEQLSKSIGELQERISKLEEKSIKRGIINEIDRELKYTKPIKKGQRRVGKYDYETNKIFNQLRDYNRLNQEDALNKLNKIPTEGLSEMEKIIARFLSYKANGMESSAILQEQVLADIREMKRIGEEAKDEADFIKKLEKQEKVEDVLKEIEKQKESLRFLKGPKMAYVSTIANLYSSLNAIAGKKIANKYDFAMFQTNSQADFNNKIEITANKAKEIYGVKSNRQLSKLFLNEIISKDYIITDETGFTEEISKFDLINIFNGLKNNLRKEQFYNAFGEEQINALLQNLSPQDIELADYLMEGVQEYREVLNERSIEIFGRDLGFVENYWPNVSEHQQEFFDDIKIQGEIPSAMKERGKNSQIIPKMANAWLIYQRHIAQAEHIKTLSRKYEELKNLFSERRIEKTIKNKYGDKVYYALMNHIETFSLNKRTDMLDVFSGAYNIALNNWVKAKVASPTVFGRQMISSIYSVEIVGIKNFLKYQLEIIGNPQRAFKFMWDNIPFIRNRFKRGYSEALQDVIRGTKDLKIGMDGITKYTTLATRGGDITAIILNGYPIIKSELAKGKSMEQAIEEFQKFTEKTQQSGSVANLSLLQRQRNAFARTFLRFKNTLNQLLRLQVDANIQFINKQISAKDFATKTILYSVYTPIMYTLIRLMITQGFKWLFGKEDEDKTEGLLGDILQQIIIQPFQTIPLIDATMETAYSEIRKRITGKSYYLGGGLFSYPLLDDISRAWSKLKKKEPSASDFLTVFSLLQEPITGIPTETILRYIKYAKAEEAKAEEIKDIWKQKTIKESKGKSLKEIWK